MKTASLKDIKTDLTHKSNDELLALCLRLVRFKKENKELISYLLFEISNEEGYIEGIKNEMLQQFSEINTSSYYFIKKSSRKILRDCKKFIRYSQNKETEVELLLFYCVQLYNFKPNINKSKALFNLYYRQIEFIKKKISLLHEDLQFDYQEEIEKLETL